MKIKSLMVTNPITIDNQTTIQEAIEVMKGHSIRHLPVVSDDDYLIGFVTLADLKQGLMPSILADVSLSDLVIKDPIAVGPDDDIETAARIIYAHKISGMPVIEESRVVGIITETDILRVFIDMMGILTASLRIDFTIPNKQGSLKRALQIIHEAGGEVINVLQSGQSAETKAFYIRLEACETKGMVQALKAEGYQVLDAMD